MNFSAENNRQVAQNFLQGLAEGDLGVVDRTMTEEVVYTIISAISPHSSDAIPWAGPHRGREAVKAYQRRLKAAQDIRVDGIDRWVADENTVAAFATLHAHRKTTGKSGSWEIASRFDFTDGLISNHVLYEDSFSAVVMHSNGGSLNMIDVEGSRQAPSHVETE